MTPAPDLQPEVAAKVLGADLRNTVKKVGDGGNLTPAEREAIEKFILAGAPLDDLRQKRRAALLRKWMMGGRLAEGEMDEIRGFLPDPVQVATHLTRESFQHPLQHYAEIYDTDKRNIKRWIKRGRGRTPPDIPPLDDPGKLAQWWARNMKWSTPAKILKLSAADAPTGKAEHPAPTPPDDARPPPGSSREIEMSEGDSFFDRLRRASEAERIAHKMYIDALQDTAINEGTIEMRFRNYQRAQEMARKMEISGQDVMKNDAAWCKIADYEREDDEIKGILNQSLRGLMVRVATKIGLPSEWFQKVNQGYQGELDIVFAELAATDFQQAVRTFELQAA